MFDQPELPFPETVLMTVVCYVCNHSFQADGVFPDEFHLDRPYICNQCEPGNRSTTEEM